MPIRLTRTVKTLLIVCFAAFLVQQTADVFFGMNLLGTFALVPAGFAIDHRFWQILTYGFLHADVMHLALNLMMLAFIGPELEAVWGRGRFLRYYFLCQIGAGAAYLFLQLFLAGSGLHYPMIGASGAIYGLLVAFGLLFGERMMLFMMLFPMKAKHFVLVLAGIEFFSTVFSSRAGLAGVAHLGGMLTGFLYLWGRATYSVWKRNQADGTGSLRKAKKRKASHLKLVINKKGENDSDDENSPKTWH